MRNRTSISAFTADGYFSERGQKKGETALKGLVRTLVLGSALFVMAGAAAVKANTVKLHCEQPKCTYSKQMKASATTIYKGWCDGEKPADYTMVCHPVNGMTCVAAAPGPEYWSCLCTNWKTKKQNVGIDLICTN